MKRIHIWLGILVVGLLGQGCDESMGDGGAAAQGEPSANHPGRIVGDSPTSTWSLLPEDDVLEEDGEGLDSESWGDDEGFGEEAVCVPDCQGRQCGPDGCGGTCGNCNDGSVCTLDHCSSVGTCFHVPSGLKGAAEVCNGVDDDCDGLVDEVGAGGCTPFFLDEDGDGFGVGEPVCLCSPNSPHEALQAGDCDDWDGAVFPGQPEACNGKDDDCDGEVESADACAGPRECRS